MTTTTNQGVHTVTDATSAPENILEKIRGLLALAEHPNTGDAEREAANERAAALIAKWGVDRAMLAADDAQADQLADRTITIEQPYGREKVSLLGWIGTAMRVKSAFRKRWNSAGDRVFIVSLYGFESDLDRVEILYTSLLIQAHRQLPNVRPEWWENATVPAYRRTWLLGFAAEVSTRLERAEAVAAQDAQATRTAAASTGPSVELVLVGRKDQVDRFYAEANPGIKDAKPRNLSGNGYAAGRIAGQQADLGQTRLSGSTRTTRGALGGR